MNARRASAIVLRQVYLLRGNPARFLPMFSYVAVDIVRAFISRYLNPVAYAGFNFLPGLLGAVSLWDFLLRVMQGVTAAFSEDVWSRNFLNFFATPLSLPEYLIGLILSSIATSALGLAIMLPLAVGICGIFGAPFFIYSLQPAPFLLVLFLFGIALGIFGSAVVLRLGPSSEWLIWLIPAPIAPFACVFIRCPRSLAGCNTWRAFRRCPGCSNRCEP